MAKKIRFPLEMENGIEVRDLESLKENFSLPRVTEYLKNGKLVIWLRDRYENDIADEIERISESEEHIGEKICKAFGVEFDDSSDEEYEKASEKAERIEKLKRYTDEDEYIENIDIVAFDQDEVYDLLDAEQTKIYLCGERFSVPLGQSGITYIGINNPTVVINSKEVVDWQKKGITLQSVSYDEQYQKIVNTSVNEDDIPSNGDMRKHTRDSIVIYNTFGGYCNNSPINVLLSPKEEDESMECFDKISKVFGEAMYDIDKDVKDMKDLLKKQIVGVAEEYVKKRIN